MQQFDTIISNGIVVTADSEFMGDIGIKDGIVQCIAQRLDVATATHVIDASQKYVMPGGIDIHTHLDTPLNGSYTLDDWYDGTVSAACGGVTCVVDYPKQEADHTVRDIIEKWKNKARDKAVIDYSFSPVITQYNDSVYQEIPQLIQEGFPGYKVFMAYWHRIHDDQLIKMLDVVSSNGGILGVHCENDWACDYLIQQRLSAGQIEPKYFPGTRPPICEYDAVSRAISLAELVDGNLLIVHLSSKQALECAQAARNRGVHVYIETCTHFLTLDEALYDQPLEEAAKYVITPPLRCEADRDALWKGCASGSISLISSDHCAFPYQDKIKMGRQNFSTIPHGAPGVEARLPIAFSEGVIKGRISASKFVELVSTNPARIAGMYPQKGTIAVGSDADITIFDPAVEMVLSTAQMHSKCDFSPFEGMKIQGYPILTMSRGVVLYDHGTILAEKGHGRLVKRKSFQRF